MVNYIFIIKKNLLSTWALFSAVFWYGCFYSCTRQWTKPTTHGVVFHATWPWTRGGWCKLISGLPLAFARPLIQLSGKMCCVLRWDCHKPAFTKRQC